MADFDASPSEIDLSPPIGYSRQLCGLRSESPATPPSPPRDRRCDGCRPHRGRRRVTSMNTLLNEFRIAFRQHVRQPGFALTVVCTLALAIGATTAVFSVVNTVLVRALPFASPERLVWVASVRPDNPNAPFTLPEFMDYRSQTRTLSGLAAYANWSASLAGDGITERLRARACRPMRSTCSGIAPAAGRLLNESDNRPDAPRVSWS